MHTHRNRILALSAIVLTAVLSACSTGGSTSTVAVTASNATDLVAPAQQEGTLTWYTAISTDAANAVITAFKAKYPGIDVQLLRSTTADLWTKFQTENAAHANVADVVNFADWGIMDQAKQSSLLAQYEPQSVQAAVGDGVLDKQYVDADGYYFASRVLAVAMVYNTQKVPANAVPKTWTDLANPYWSQQGQLGILDPAKTATINAYYAMDAAGIAAPFFTAIAPLKPKIYDQGGSILNALSSGEIDGGIITDYDAWGLIAKDSTAPYAVVYPSAGVGAWYDYEAVAAAAPHPNAARLFAEFIGSEEGSAAIAQSATVYMVRKDVSPYPATRPPFASLNILPLDPAKVAADRDAFLKKFDTWIGR